MKSNRIERPRAPRALLVTLALISASALIIALLVGYGRLKAVYLEQCVIHDLAAQVSITAGKMVKEDVIAECFGLHVGANLAEIDFTEKRAEVLDRIHTLRDISITRHLPDRVTIVAEERTPVAKLGIRGLRNSTGKVVDTDGMVFVCRRGTQLLPTIYEPTSPGTASGHKVKERAFAALKLIETCREPKFAELGVQDVDTSKPDYLVATLGNYSKAKIAWDQMDDWSVKSQADLESQLSNLIMVIRSQTAPGTRTWNATIHNRIFADTQENR